MKFVMAGSSGFLGTAWREHLAREGHEVVRLVRRDVAADDESRWDPVSRQIDAAVVESADVVANVAGTPLTHWPWTAGYQRTFVESRVGTTRTLAEAVARSASKPALVAQNGVAGYGDRADLVLTEASDTDAETFMGRVTRGWEQATAPAAAAGARVVVLRSAPVLDKRGAPLKQLSLLFRAGLGGKVGGGQQYFPTISLSDWLRAATFLATHEGCSGPYNLAGPNPSTNAEFSAELARMLHRPAVIPVPAWPVRAALAPIATEILGSSRVEPARLLEAGFEFEHPTLNSRLAAALT
jgi:uncharacterized protein